MPIVLLWWSSAVAAMTIAMAKDRSPVGWLVIALLAGPLAMLLLLAQLYDAIRLKPEAMELCDACLEPVRRDRTACRHCGR